MQWLEHAGLIATSARSLPPFGLLVPHSIDDAVAALQAGERPVPIAGGSDLVATFNEGLAPTELVSLQALDTLQHITAGGGGVRIGATVTHAAGSSHPLLRQHAPGFATAWAAIANPRIRFVGTLGGNLMARRTRYEASVLLAAADARLEFASADGPLQLSAADLWAGAAPERGLLTTIHLPTDDLVAYVYERALRPLMTLAIAVRRARQGLQLCCAVASEFQAPVLLRLPLPASPVTAQARTIAAEVFAQLPASFADAALTNDHARHVGAVLLARRLEDLPGV